MIARQAALRTVAGILAAAEVPLRQQAAALRKQAAVCVKNANGLAGVATMFAGEAVEAAVTALRDEAEAYNASAGELDRKADEAEAREAAEAEAQKDKQPGAPS